MIRRIITTILVLCLGLTLAPQQAFAHTPEEINYYTHNNIIFNDDTPVTCAVENVETNLIGNDNIEKAYRFFIQPPRSLTPQQSAGILGNLIQESGVNYKTVQTSGGSAKGIAQWEGSRFTNLVSFAQKRGVAWDSSLEVQLDFMWHELTTYESGSLKALKATTTVADAARVFVEKYERAGIPHLANRIKYANSVYAKYSGLPAQGGEATPVGIEGGCTGPGEDTKFVDGFAIYAQCDPAWGNKPYASTTICDGGCGPAALAMVITNLTAKRVTPLETATYAASKGLYIPGVGSSHDISPVLAANWGLKAKKISRDKGQIVEALKAGGLIVTSGKGAKPFTSGGHILVIRGVTTNGKFMIADSGHRDTSAKEWDADFLLDIMNPANVWVITK